MQINRNERCALGFSNGIVADDSSRRLDPGFLLLAKRIHRYPRFPHAALVDENGLVVAAGLTNTREHVESLLEAKHHGVSSLQEFMEKNASAAGER